MTTTNHETQPACPSWCDYQHREPGGSHSVDLLPGEEWTDTHGPLMTAVVQSDHRRTELWVDLSCNTMTADMADRMAEALKRGASILRQQDSAADDVQLCGYPDGYGGLDPAEPAHARAIRFLGTRPLKALAGPLSPIGNVRYRTMDVVDGGLGVGRVLVSRRSDDRGIWCRGHAS